ncbi:methyltransferase [Staphylococcus succinus]|nr:methyltransferase [Staphylococcus succinus]
MNKDRFDQIAEKYDGPDRIYLAEIISTEVSKLFENKKYHSLLDYGGGTGLVTFNIEHYFDSITLMDASPKMIEVFEHKCAELGILHIHTQTGNILLDTSLLNQTYDVIFLSLVLLHSGDYESLLRQLYAHLNPNGMLVIVDFNKNEQVFHPNVYNGFNQSDIKHAYTQLGLTDIDTHTFYSGKNLFMNHDASLFIATGIKNSPTQY